MLDTLFTELKRDDLSEVIKSLAGSSDGLAVALMKDLKDKVFKWIKMEDKDGYYSGYEFRWGNNRWCYFEAEGEYASHTSPTSKVRVIISGSYYPGGDGDEDGFGIEPDEYKGSVKIMDLDGEEHIISDSFGFAEECFKMAQEAFREEQGKSVPLSLCEFTRE